MKGIKLAIADDHTLFRRGVSSLVAGFKGIDIVIEAENGQDLLDQMKKVEPDVILMDIKMPVMDGIDATRKIRATNHDVKIIALSMHDNERFIFTLIESGANGYLLKYAEPEELEDAIRHVHLHGYYFNDYVSRAIVSGLIQHRNGNPDFNDKARVTDRETEILRLICEEKTNPEIAKILNLSVRTVEGHRTKLIEKVGARNTAGLVIYAIKNGVI